MNSFSNEFSPSDVQKWVKDFFEDVEVDTPEFKENNECMKLISNIICLNKEAEKDATEVIKTDNHLADYYTKRDQEIQNIFGEEFSARDLCSDSLENVKKISSVATQMKLKEPTITNFLLSSSDLENKREECLEHQIINTFTLSKFSKKITDVMQKNSSVERDIESLEKIVSKQQNIKSELPERCKFLKIKREEYKKKAKRIEEQLKNLGWSPSLSHNELVKRAEGIQCLENKVNDLTSKLKSYQNLPPNEMLARFKVEEAQADLLRLQNEFDNLLTNIC